MSLEVDIWEDKLPDADDIDIIKKNPFTWLERPTRLPPPHIMQRMHMARINSEASTPAPEVDVSRPVVRPSPPKRRRDPPKPKYDEKVYDPTLLRAVNYYALHDGLSSNIRKELYESYYLHEQAGKLEEFFEEIGKAQWFNLKGNQPVTEPEPDNTTQVVALSSLSMAGFMLGFYIVVMSCVFMAQAMSAATLGNLLLGVVSSGMFGAGVAMFVLSWKGMAKVKELNKK